jgi:hypothetical protein
MTKIKLSLLTALVFASAGANAEGTYVELGYGAMKYAEEGVSLKPTIGRAIVGRDVSENIAIEGMAAAGISSGDTTYSGIGISLKLDNAVGFYVKPKLKINESLEVFGRAGLTHISGTATATGNRGSLSLDMSGSDTSFGIGAKVAISKTTYAVVDYMSYYSKNGVTVKGYTFGLGMAY